MSLHVWADLPDRDVTLRLNNVSMEKFLDELKEQTSINILYNAQMFKETPAVTVNAKDEPWQKVLQKVLRPLGFEYAVKNDIVVIRPIAKEEGKTEEKVIKGSVVDTDGLPLAGATITIKHEDGTSTYARADMDGNFQVAAVGDETSLTASFLGYKLLELKANAKGDNYNFRLESDSQYLEEVVVTGIFDRKKEGFTGSAVTLKGDDLKKYSATNIAKALSAVAPGFRIVENIDLGSNPNGLPEMSLRGQANMDLGNATTSNEFLSVQGEYETYPNQPLIILDGFETTTQKMVDLDPERVASVTLLKDAAATAIYGSRAANGVIVIETKTPKAGRLWVTYGGELRVETPDLTDYNLMNAEEKLATEWAAGMYTASGITAEKLELYQRKLHEVKRGVNTYWLDKPLRTAFQQRHTLTLEGGDQALRYSIYAGYNMSPGVMKDSKRDVFTGEFNIQYRFKKFLLKNRLTLDNSTADESPWGSFSQYTRLNPYLRAYDENGEIPQYLDDFSNLNVGQANYPNPMYNTTFKTKDRSTNLSFTELFSAEWNPNADWRIVGNFSLTKSSGNRDVFRPAQHTAFANITDPALKGDYARTESSSLNWQVDLTASYNKLINNLHYITGSTRFTMQETTSESYAAHVTGFPNENMDEILFGSRYDEKMEGLESTSRLLSWVAAMGYSYKYKYSIDFNIRLDGSSQFGTNNRWAPFWSAGLRWDLKKENFLKDVDFLSDLVLRGTYGITGSQGFDPYQAHLYYSYSNLLKPYYSSDVTGAEIYAMPNEDLKWQETRNLNLALEMGFLDGRLTGRIEWYRKITNNMLTSITLAPSLGFNTYPANLGKIENQGIEFSLSAIPYQDRANQAYWTITVNGSRNKDKLLKISEAMRHMNEVNNANQDDTPLSRYVEGESLNRIWVVRSLGIDPSTGLEIFQKRNGDMTGEYDPVDIVPIGNTEPDWQGFINSSFTYRGWGADVSFQYRFGGQVYNQTLLDKVENASLVYNVDRRVMDLRWQKPGDRSRFKTLNYLASDTKASSRFIMDENVFQWSSLSLYYRMDPQNAPFISKLSLSSAKVSFNMEDLFYLSTVKRERGLDYPYARTFTFSLNLTF